MAGWSKFIEGIKGIQNERVYREKNKKDNKHKIFVASGFEMIHNSISITHKFVDVLRRALQAIKLFL